MKKIIENYTDVTDVNSLDRKAPTPEQITKNVVDKVTDGSIVLMHNGAKNTLAAISLQG